MSLKDITITGSIGSIATQSYGQRTYIASSDEQSFPIEHITGSDAKTWPNFVQGTNYTVDLVVNVTQSWAGSNVTPLGDVPYIHNTMEEFIDGEFSGSNYVVTNGSLTDADCEQFLTVNTTPTNYAIFPYYASSSKTNSGLYLSYLNPFLNYNTIPRPGEAYFFTHQGFSSGQYLKIARVDQDGNNNTLSLQELTSFRWTDSVLGKVILTVKNITEYPNYYFYEVIDNFSTDISLTDDNFLNYKLYAESANGIIPAGLFYIDNWTVYSNASGDFNLSGYYNFANTPNCNIQYTASILIQNPNAASVNFDFGFWAYDSIYYTAIDTVNTTIAGFATQAVTLKGLTYQLIGGSNVTYHLETNNLNLSVNSLGAAWTITQSLVPQSFTSSVVIEPYLLSNFNNSDCDVLMNNASINDVSEIYREVLYANGGTIPSNFQQIISGTADFAQVNDYLFNANASVLPRYKGVRTTSANFNLPSTNGFSNEELANIKNSTALTITNGTPNVQGLNTVIAYVDWWGGWPSERMNASGAHIKYLINSDGTVSIPNISNIALYSNQNAFKSGERVIVSTQNDATPTTQYRNIIRGATRIEPILYNQIRNYNSPPMTFTSSIYFTDNNPYSTATVKDFTATLSPNTYYAITSPVPSGIFMNVIKSQGVDIGGALSITNHYTITSDIINEHVGLIFDIYLEITNNNPTYGTWVYASLYEDSTGSPILIGTQQSIRIGAGVQYKPIIFPKFSIPNTGLVLGNSYSVTIWTPVPITGLYYESTCTFKISTSPLPTPAVSSSNLFLTSSYPNSSSYLFITNSIAIQYYGNSQVKQVDFSGSLFNPITLPFTIQTGDEFRFEGDETKVFMVESVNPTSFYQLSSSVTQSAIEIKLDKQISGSYINTDQFLIRRYVDDASMILLEGFKPVNSTGPYVVRPEFVTPELNKNIDQIIQDLTQKGLI